ncbi:MAG: alpha/beta hydrolase [Gemmatimonadales bacterium]
MNEPAAAGQGRRRGLRPGVLARYAAAVVAGLLLPGTIAMAFPDLAARFARAMIFYPERLSEREADPGFWGLKEGESVFIDAEDGERLHAWWVPAAVSPDDDPDAGACRAAIFFHGNAGNIASRARIAARLSGLGLGTLLVDYRGYGRSGGRPSEEGLYKDGRAAYRHVVEARAVPAEQVVVIGNSLGAAVAASVASENPVGRLVLTGAFRSVPALGRSIYWWIPNRAFNWSFNHFDAESAVRLVEAPVLVGRGDRDALIPRDETRAIYEAAPQPKRWVEVPVADHSNLWFTEELWRELASFVGESPCSPTPFLRR